MGKGSVVKAAAKVSSLTQDSPLSEVLDPPVLGASAALQCLQTNDLCVLSLSPNCSL